MPLNYPSASQIEPLSADARKALEAAQRNYYEGELIPVEEPFATAIWQAACAYQRARDAQIALDIGGRDDSLAWDIAKAIEDIP